MKKILLICLIAGSVLACKKQKEKRITGIYTGHLDYVHLSVNKETGDSTIHTTAAESGIQVQIIRDEDDMVFIREIYRLPLKDVSLNKTNLITVEEHPKQYILALDVFDEEIYFKETIQSDLSFSFSYQIFEFNGFRD